MATGRAHGATFRSRGAPRAPNYSVYFGPPTVRICSYFLPVRRGGCEALRETSFLLIVSNNLKLKPTTHRNEFTSRVKSHKAITTWVVTGEIPFFATVSRFGGWLGSSERNELWGMASDNVKLKPTTYRKEFTSRVKSHKKITTRVTGPTTSACTSHNHLFLSVSEKELRKNSLFFFFCDCSSFSHALWVVRINRPDLRVDDVSQNAVLCSTIFVGARKSV